MRATARPPHTPGVRARHDHARGRSWREGRDHRLRVLREAGPRGTLGAQPADRRADQGQEDRGPQVQRGSRPQGRRLGCEEAAEADPRRREGRGAGEEGDAKTTAKKTTAAKSTAKKAPAKAAAKKAAADEGDGQEGVHRQEGGRRRRHPPRRRPRPRPRRTRRRPRRLPRKKTASQDRGQEGTRHEGAGEEGSGQGGGEEVAGEEGSRPRSPEPPYGGGPGRPGPPPASCAGVRRAASTCVGRARPDAEQPGGVEVGGRVDVLAQASARAAVTSRLPTPGARHASPGPNRRSKSVAACTASNVVPVPVGVRHEALALQPRPAPCARSSGSRHGQVAEHRGHGSGGAGGQLGVRRHGARR